MPSDMRPSTQSKVAHEVIESVVRMTEQRDDLMLLLSLQGSILEMLPKVEASIICLVPDSDGQWGQDLDFSSPTPMFPVTSELMQAVVGIDAEKMLNQFTFGDHVYLIGNLGIQDERRKAILVRQPEWNQTDLQIARGMLNIYGNFARVLFDSERDTLTGLYNRKKLEQKLGELVSGRMRASKREGDENVSDYLAVFDIDHFKRINDNFGHLMGDEVLLVFAGLVRTTLRDADWVFRYGGEEFVAIVKGAAPEAIAQILERVRTRVQDHVFPQVGQVTVSIGFTAIVDQQLPSYVFEEADKALYYAKETGRNRVCSYGDLVSSGEIAQEAPQSGSVELF